MIKGQVPTRPRGFGGSQGYVDLSGAEEPIRENAMPRIAAPRLVPQSIRNRCAA